MVKVYLCDAIKIEAYNLSEAAHRYSKKFGERWLRFTTSEKGKGCDSQNHYGEIPDSLKGALAHFKQVARDDTWQIIQINTREFDQLSMAKMREICKHFNIGISFVTPCKEMILDVLDGHIDKVRNYLQNEELLKYLGDFCHTWYYSDGKKQDISLSLTTESPKRVIDTSKKGIIESLLELIDLSEDKCASLSQELDTLKTSHSNLKKDLEDVQDTVLIFEKAGTFFCKTIKSTPEEVIVELSLDEKESCSQQINVTKEGFVEYFLKTIRGLSKRNKSLEKASLATKKKEENAWKKVGELTATLEKIHSSFEMSEAENVRLRNNNDNLSRELEQVKADLIMARSETAILKTELVMAKIVPEETKKSTELKNSDDVFFLSTTLPDGY